MAEAHDLHTEALAEGPLKISCSSGAELSLEVDPAHSRLGVGFFYEVVPPADWTDVIQVTETPA